MKIVAPLIILHKMTDQFWLNDQFYDCIVCDESGGILLTLFFQKHHSIIILKKLISFDWMISFMIALFATKVVVWLLFFQ